MAHPAISERYSPEPAEAAVPVAPGQIIGERYLVGSVIGEGGMGVVCSATHLGLGTQVAIKLIRSDLKHDPESVVRFQNEARMAASLKGDHIARVYDVGQLATGEPYLVMEQLEGMGLDAFIHERAPLAQADAVDIVLQACEGLAEAHAAGLVHRDIKAANLFLARRPDQQFVLKILDFGISKRLMDGALRGLTNPGRSMGSPWYMSPEQMLSPSTVDQRADVWSLGVLLFELLTNDYPFNGDGVVQVCANVLTTEAPSLSERRPDLDPRLDAAVRCCLQKQVDQRYASVEVLAEALRPLSSRAQQARASELAPSEGLTLSIPPPEEVIPLVAVAESPSRPPTHSDTVRENATSESLAPVAAGRQRRERGHQRASVVPRKRSAGSYLAVVCVSLLLGAGISWIGWPYVYARYGAPDWHRLATARLPWEPGLSPDVLSPRALDRERPVQHLAIWASSPAVEARRPTPPPVAAPAPTQPPALSAEEIQRRSERYELWLAEQGLKRIQTERDAVDPASP